MSGFRKVNISNQIGIFGIKKGLRKVLQLGKDFDDLAIKKRIGVGVNEAQYLTNSNAYDGMSDPLYYAKSMDLNVGSNKHITFFQKDYVQQREYLRNMSIHREISKFIDILADEAIVYDTQNYFMYADNNIFDGIDESMVEKLKESLQDNFEFIYTKALGFKQSALGWRLFRQYLIDGALAFEIIYNEDDTEIIKIVPIDPAYLATDIVDIDGVPTNVWVQYPNDNNLKRILPDTHVIYVSYGKNNTTSNISYVQELIRSFNLYRTMENTAIIWNIMNSTFRMKMVVPVTGAIHLREQNLAKQISKYREDIQIESDSGEVFMDGQPKLNLYRNYAFAEHEGRQTQIESIKFEGYDLQNADLLKFYRDRLWEDSQIPFSRLQKDGGVTFNNESNGIEREEIRFGKLINRFRSDYQEIIVKPLIIQMQLNYPDLTDDGYFDTKISVQFNKENIFEELRQKDVMKKDIEFISSLMSLKNEDGESYFDYDLIVEEFSNFDYDLLEKNKKRKAEKKKLKESEEGDKPEDSEDSEDSGDDGGFFDDFGGGDDSGGTPDETTTETEIPE